MRAFLRLREILATHKEIASKLEEVEKNYDAQFRVVFAEIRKLTQPVSIPLKRQIGLIPRKREVVGFEVAICGLKNFPMRPRCEKHHVPLRRIFTRSGKLLWLCQYSRKWFQPRKLRSHILTVSPRGGHLSRVLLLREGVATSLRGLLYTCAIGSTGFGLFPELIWNLTVSVRRVRLRNFMLSLQVLGSQSTEV